MTSPQEQHADVGAYALGLLDDADATRFETHLAGCELCMAELDSLAGLEPLLAEYAAATPGPGAFLPVPGSTDDALLGRLLDEVAEVRARTRRRRMFLVAAAAVLIIGGPLIAVQATSGDRTSAVAEHAHGGPAEDAFNLIPASAKVSGTDPATKVSATIGVEKKAWGSHVVLQLGNVKGPLRCSLVAVGKNGDQQTVTTWAVGPWGYGIPDSPHETARTPLYMHGGAAMQPNEVDHYEVRTLDGRTLVDVKA
ncbi:zf-HC2 domain-containing protein [Streptomyces sp. SID13666]|uniref:zf-HC2 domain-containing protein n=1 Tax=Streptomyces TaxID=1883 RepID=UPI00110712CC|nr:MULTISPECIES: zf-HC2 domain-containing protein [Streptomyces]MCZ4097008.1 zf-HC2 domain-containing protein [Streptomyces sp. H39-C1]NEA56981.1 zf-HC2 domain-containing protein [Streptomyces sp. SID13666]NEA74895.1 zf-HC2 domain-containing protein [Streptomyces sp. SID13588]QNA74749.1 zf-HC2 domain-containing protein [Streptomyces sp. So13.3]